MRLVAVVRLGILEGEAGYRTFRHAGGSEVVDVHDNIPTEARAAVAAAFRQALETLTADETVPTVSASQQNEEG